ncbi:hypothetical protein [Escherichia coli]|uniref:hypothetical protein n=1 Tax=Escherichia coli TaxID=562 RepID=UPI0002514494|nr:hypothetical protein [Escherichia coli]EHV91555.1 putative prophage protein [Escherichia coli DEC7D]MBB8579292.1 hypothetical protein [Escherichia coli]
MLGNDLPIWGCYARLDCVTTEDCARMVAVTVASRQRKIAAAQSVYRANTA